MLESIECEAAELHALGRDLVDAGVSLRFEVRGWSMYPFIKNGDLIEVAHAAVEDIAAGDVVFFRSGQRLLAHRVVGHGLHGQELCLRVRGDRFLYEDPPVYGRDLVGRVGSVCRKQRIVRLDRGLNRYLGLLVVRSKAVHHCVRLLALCRQRLGALEVAMATPKGNDVAEADKWPAGEQSH